MTPEPGTLSTAVRTAPRRSGCRIEANLSQAALADELGFDRRVLQRIEAGEPTLYITRVFALLARLHLRLEVRGDGVPGHPPAPGSDATMPPWSITDRPAATHP